MTIYNLSYDIAYNKGEVRSNKHEYYFVGDGGAAWYVLV